MHSARGWWYYYPVAFVVKTPVATLAALALAAVLTVTFAERGGLRRLGGWRAVPFACWTMAVPPAIYLVSCLASHVDTGLRQLLPAYPFLFALASAGLFHRRWKGRPAVLGLLACLVAVETLAVYPHFTAFFNRAVGGPAAGRGTWWARTSTGARISRSSSGTWTSTG